MGTTCSSGLNNLLNSSAQTQTTLPSWYTAAQQNIVNQANQAQAAAPQFQNTTQQNAVNTLQSNVNPYSQAEGTLNTIATGAANPWNVCASSGAVTPNTNTAMGGLFAAQQQQLNQILPQAVAPVQACGIGSGNFGSLRGQTALNSARANAFDQLAAQQMAAAVQNQQTGVSAANALSGVGTACIGANMTVGQQQQNAPYLNPGNYANLINALQAPTTVTTQQQMSPLCIANTLYKTGSGILNSTAGQNILCKLGLGNLFGSGNVTCHNTGCASTYPTTCQGAGLQGTATPDCGAYSCGNV